GEAWYSRDLHPHGARRMPSRYPAAGFAAGIDADNTWSAFRSGAGVGAHALDGHDSGGSEPHRRAYLLDRDSAARGHRLLGLLRARTPRHETRSHGRAALRVGLRQPGTFA